LELLAGRDVMCLKKTKEGYPIHPLYVAADTEPIKYQDRPGGEMNQKSNQSKEQLDSELLQLPPTNVLPEETLIALLQSGDSRGLEEAQKYIDDHITVRHWRLTTLREKLIKIGAKVVRHSRKVIFQMAEVTVPRELFRSILQAIERLRLARVVSG